MKTEAGPFADSCDCCLFTHIKTFLIELTHSSQRLHCCSHQHGKTRPVKIQNLRHMLRSWWVLVAGTATVPV